MKANKDDFNNFQRYFKEYQQRFGLMQYQVYFKFERIDGSFARIKVNEVTKVVTVSLNNKLPKEDKPFQDIKRSAKHEALHLLINELDDLAWARFINKDQIEEASEALVNKLINLIGDGDNDVASAPKTS